MTAGDHATSPFAIALRSAIRDSGLSLEGVARRLGTKGVRLTAGTLSHWQSGRTSPGRRDSLRAVGHLEKVLGLPPDALGELIRQPHLRGRPPRESRMIPIAISYHRGARVRELLAEVDLSFDEQLMRISQHDRLRVGRDRAQESLVVRQVLRATHDGPDRFVIAFWQDADHPLPQLRAMRGCVIGKVVPDSAANVLVAELMFDRPLSRGETVVTEHEFVSVSSPPGDNTDWYGRSLRHQSRECLIEVDFHPGALPARCCETFAPVDDPERIIRRRLVIDSRGSVHAVATGVGPGTLQISWDWAEPANY